MSTCLFEYSIAHLRSSEGYYRSWYDAIAAPETEATYTTTVPSGLTGDIYFMVDSYPIGTIPIYDDIQKPFNDHCIGKRSTDPNDWNVLLTLEQRSSKSVTVKKYHDDGYAVPIIVRTYEPDDEFTIKVTYLWNGDAQ